MGKLAKLALAVDGEPLLLGSKKDIPGGQFDVTFRLRGSATLAIEVNEDDGSGGILDSTRTIEKAIRLQHEVRVVVLDEKSLTNAECWVDGTKFEELPPAAGGSQTPQAEVLPVGSESTATKEQNIPAETLQAFGLQFPHAIAYNRVRADGRVARFFPPSIRVEEGAPLLDSAGRCGASCVLQ